MALAVRRLILGTVAAALALLAAEVALRVWGTERITGGPMLDRLRANLGPGLTVPDDELLVRLRPGVEFLDYYRVNQRGWRGAEVHDERPPDTLRIVAMGDSCTFGFGVNESQTWPSRLADMLDVAYAGALELQVVNTGVPGYSTWQNLQQLRLDVPALDPDLVVLLPTGHNDITGAKRFSDREAAAWKGSWRATLERTRLHQLLAGPSPEQDLEVPPPEQPGRAWRVSPDDSRENLLAMAEECAALGAPLVLVAPSHGVVERDAQPAYQDFARMVVQVATDSGLPLADPRPVFEQHPPGALFVDPVHPDAEGHAWIALAVLGALVSHEGLLPHPRSEWLAAWWRARGTGLTLAHEQSLMHHAPPALRRTHGALLDPQPDLSPRPGAPNAVLRFDPLFGSHAVRRAGALGLLARVARNPGQASKLQTRADEAARFLVPTDPLVRLLGDEPLDLPRLALARALLVFEAGLGVPRAPHDLRVSEAKERLNARDVSGAVALLEQALSLQPDDPRVLYALAAARRATGDRPGANAALARLVEVAPHSPSTLTHLARGALAAGRIDEAESLLRQALGVHPAWSDARYLLGRLLLDTGRLDEADQQLAAARAFAASNTYPDIAQLFARISAERAAAAAPR